MAELVLSPQQEKFLQGYLDPESDTWGNARQSALSAGYSQEYADNITNLMPKWLETTLNDTTLVKKALDNLSDFIGNRENANIQWDATKFVLTTLGKNKFTSRTETSIIIDNENKDKANQLVKDYLGNTAVDKD